MKRERDLRASDRDLVENDDLGLRKLGFFSRLSNWVESSLLGLVVDRWKLLYRNLSIFYHNQKMK